MNKTLEQRIIDLEKRKPPPANDIDAMGDAIDQLQSHGQTVDSRLADLESRLNSIGLRLDQIRPVILTDGGEQRQDNG